MLILSFILLALGRTIPKLPPEVCGLLLETGIDNMAAILVKDITLVEFTHRILQLPDLVKLKRDITHLKRTTSEPPGNPCFVISYQAGTAPGNNSLDISIES